MDNNPNYDKAVIGYIKETYGKTTTLTELKPPLLYTARMHLCSNCNAYVQKGKYCSECGAKVEKIL